MHDASFTFLKSLLRTPSPSGLATAVHRGQSAATQVPSVEPLPPPVPTATEQPAFTSPARPSAIAALPAATPTPLDRPSVRLDVAAVAAPSEPPLTANELAAAAPRRSPLGLIAGIVALLGLIAALIFALRPAPEPQKVVTPMVVDAGAPQLAAAPPEVVVNPPTEVDAGPAQLPEAVPLPAVEAPTLTVKGRLTAKAWIVTNSARTNWTRCRMTLPGQKVIDIGTMGRGLSVDLPLRRFVFDPNALPILNQARVDCSQGFGLIDLP